jgi:hypothetical protein
MTTIDEDLPVRADDIAVWLVKKSHATLASDILANGQTFNGSN